MAGDPPEAFQHFQALQLKAPCFGVKTRENGRFDRMGVQNRSSLRCVDQHQMECCFCARFALPGDDCAVLIDLDQLVYTDASFVNSTGGHQDPQRLLIQDNAEISPGAIAPTTLCEPVDGVDQLLLWLWALS